MSGGGGGGDKKGDFKQGRVFGGVGKYQSKIHPANWPKWILRTIEIFPHSCTFVTLFAFLGHHFTGTKKKEEQTTEMIRGKVVPNRSAVFGTPGIIVVDKDPRFIGKFLKSSHIRNIVFRTVIPRHLQSLGATERRRGHVRMIIDHMIGNNNKPNSSGENEWVEFAEMATMRLNSQVQQFDGFAPGKSVFGRAPKIPIGTVGGSHFGDFTNPSFEAPNEKPIICCGRFGK